jgi:hypothetical protein
MIPTYDGIPAWLHGITVSLQSVTQTGTDSFGMPEETETWTDIPDVLVGQPTDAEQAEALDFFGKRAVYSLGIPKGDTHDWVDKKVEWTDAYGNTFTVKTFGYPVTGIEANVPGQWHMKVKCEAYG